MPTEQESPRSKTWTTLTWTPAQILVWARLGAFCGLAGVYPPQLRFGKLVHFLQNCVFQTREAHCHHGKLFRAFPTVLPACQEPETPRKRTFFRGEPPSPSVLMGKPRSYLILVMCFGCGTSPPTRRKRPRVDRTIRSGRRAWRVLAAGPLPTDFSGKRGGQRGTLFSELPCQGISRCRLAVT